MPEKVEKQVRAITRSCMEQGKKKKECERLSWAVVNSQKSAEPSKKK